MHSFKQFLVLIEATLQDLRARGFQNPPPRARYQLNDYVVVKSDNRWQMYQPNRSNQYIGQHGKVVGYKAVTGGYVKYAVQFADKNIETVHSHYVTGPFKDEATAKKYSGKPKDFSFAPKINPSDVKGFSGAGNLINAKLEALLKQKFTTEPFKLTWLDKPMQFYAADGKLTASVIAFRPLNQIVGKGKKIKNSSRELRVTDGKFINFVNNNVTIFRLNNAVNGKLVNETLATKLYDYASAYSPYNISMPYLDIKHLEYEEIPIDFTDGNSVVDSFLASSRGSFGIKTLPLVASALKDENNFNAFFVNQFESMLQLLSGKLDVQKFFNTIYDVYEKMGTKFIKNRNVVANGDTLKFFMNYSFEPRTKNQHGQYSDQTLKIVENDVSKIKQIPPGMPNVSLQNTQDTYAISKKNQPIINDFAFVPSTVKDFSVNNYQINSLRGLPEQMNNLEIYNCTMANLRGLTTKMVKDIFSIARCGIASFEGGQNTTVGGQLNVYDERSIKSLKYIPDAKRFVLPEPFTEKQARKVVDDRKFVEKMKPKTKEHFADIFGNL